MTTISIYDHATGETIVRDMTAEEITEREEATQAWLEQKSLRETQAEALAATKIAVLERLGITEVEAKALLS